MARGPSLPVKGIATMSPRAGRRAAGFAFAIGLSLVRFQDALAQSEPPSPEHVKELYFDAARAGRIDLLDGLIEAGMNPNEHDPRGFTPLIWPRITVRRRRSIS